MLQTALETRATRIHVTHDDGRVLWFHGDELVGTATHPKGIFVEISEELCALGAQGDTTSFLSVQSPAGPLEFSVELTPQAIRLVLRDEQTADAEAAFDELMRHLVTLGADRVTCAKDEARFAKGDKALESVPLVAKAIALLVAHGKVLGSLDDTTRSGRAVLFGGGKKRVLSVQLVDDGVAFTVS